MLFVSMCYGGFLGVAAPFLMAPVTIDPAAEPSEATVEAVEAAVVAAVEPSMPKVSTALAIKLYRNGGSTVLAAASEVWAPALAAALVVWAPASTILTSSLVTSWRSEGSLDGWMGSGEP